VAFDWHDQPYYGKPTLGMVGTQPKRGACYAFSFLTASILTPRRRLVLCIIPLTSREEGAWYGKRDLIELELHMAVMNGYAEGIANGLRRQGKAPTGETLLGYIKAMTCDEMLANAEAQIESRS